MSDKKSEAAKLKEKLFHIKKHSALEMDESEIKKSDEFAAGYKKYLDAAKTERLAVRASVEIAAKQGFSEFDPAKAYKPGDRVFVNNRGKAAIFAIIGSKPIAEGARIIAAHIDSPRLDLKPSPLYEDNELALFKTHYYGGIKKYQWTAVPLALFGTAILRNGNSVDISIGDSDDEPCFVITDLLPHLATEQSKRTLADGIRGEELNIVIGSFPFKDDKESELVKLNIMNILFEKYGITEREFITAELSAVPAGKARDVGLDRSMIGAYGHDDRVCAYPALVALLELTAPEYTAVTVLADKEEIGSDGNTGLKSSFLENFIKDLSLAAGTAAHRALENSKCLSADVNAAFDPTFSDVAERKNAAFLNRGAAIMKYSGSRGKGGTSDASAEYMGEICKLLDENNVPWQWGELGKVDLGGGGTVAKYVANLGVDTVDIGVAVLSMHSPFEIVSKLDLYNTYRAFTAFYK